MDGLRTAQKKKKEMACVNIQHNNISQRRKYESEFLSRGEKKAFALQYPFYRIYGSIIFSGP